LRQFQQVKEFILGTLKKELPGYLFYHNIDHTVDVLEAAENIADQEGIAENDKELLLTAALFHDTGFLKAREGHETESCNIARYYLPAYNYKPDEIERICDMIMATKLPQSPRNHLEEILCDADLDYLGRDDFSIFSNKLFSELNTEGLIKEENEWNRQQSAFMEGHHYFTKTSLKLRHGKKDDHVKLIKSKLQTTSFK
jgi:uncharacterized protein